MNHLSERARSAVAVLGDLEPVVRTCLLASWNEVRVVISPPDTATRRVVGRALDLHATAAVIPRDQLAELDLSSAQDVMVLGLSVASTDVLLLVDGRWENVDNPDPAELEQLILDRATTRR